tara:strand:- start:149 stop:547 length:399 start_codon:yes stop_codon:yes gene_type:complete
MFNNSEIKQLLLMGFILTTIDVTFLNFFFKSVFGKMIKNIQNKEMKVNYFGAIYAYVLLCLGLYYFIIRENKSPLDAFLLGVFVYGVYEGTSYALLNKWEIKVLVMDSLWGGVLFALTTFIFNSIKTMFIRY